MALDASRLVPELELVEIEEAEEASEEKEQLPVVDENGVVHLTRTTAKGG